MDCYECRIGHYQPICQTYHSWLGEQFITVPDAPAFLCDVCGHTFFDPHFMRRMDTLIAEFEAMSQPVANHGQRPSTGPLTSAYRTPSGVRE